ncbi:uncharacterized protein LOC131517994 [Neofelis nebulosa]|uniref:uncharacterized protein LOC131517994 n=1 Tax=Neofelis nebulosa TaxID=61452 RepID=UPI00272ABDBF|nr:uncharacterized protein LOC131517994 [Neofelis nebulosa]
MPIERAEIQREPNRVLVEYCAEGAGQGRGRGGAGAGRARGEVSPVAPGACANQPSGSSSRRAAFHVFSRLLSPHFQSLRFTGRHAPPAGSSPTSPPPRDPIGAPTRPPPGPLGVPPPPPAPQVVCGQRRCARDGFCDLLSTERVRAEQSERPQKSVGGRSCGAALTPEELSEQAVACLKEEKRLAGLTLQPLWVFSSQPCVFVKADENFMMKNRIRRTATEGQGWRRSRHQMYFMGGNARI